MGNEYIPEQPNSSGAEHVAPFPNVDILEKKKINAKKIADKLFKNDKRVVYIITSEGIHKKANQLSKKEQRHELIKCALDPIYFVKTYLKIFDQTKGDGGEIILFDLFYFQETLIKSYRKNRFNVANKYRQGGVSTTTCAFITWVLLFTPPEVNVSIAVVANKLDTARDELLREVDSFIEQCPSWMIKKKTTNTKTHKVYGNPATSERQIKAFAATEGSLRGYTPTLLFWDETAHAPDGDRFWEGARPALQTGGKCIFVSTPLGLDPVFYKIFTAAIKKESAFVATELYWWQDNRYNKKLEWIKDRGKDSEIKKRDIKKWSLKKRLNLIKAGWEATSPWFEGERKEYAAEGKLKQLAQELLCSFLGSGDNFIPEEIIKGAEEILTKNGEPIRKEYIDRNFWIWEEPIKDEKYVMGIDVSSGVADDFSVINILKIGKNSELHQVAEYKGMVKPLELAEMVYGYGKKYHNAYAVIDVTGGYGAGTLDRLLELGYENIHYSEIKHKPTKDRYINYVKTISIPKPDGTGNMKVDLIPGFFIGNNRGMVLQEMQRAIITKDFKVKSLRLVDEWKTFVTVPGTRVADHKRSFHDDSIMSIAIACFVIAFDMKRFDGLVSTTKALLDAYTAVRYGPPVNDHEPPPRLINQNAANPYGLYGWLLKDLPEQH